jgi:hypothetical protein
MTTGQPFDILVASTGRFIPRPVRSIPSRTSLNDRRLRSTSYSRFTLSLGGFPNDERDGQQTHNL